MNKLAVYQKHKNGNYISIAYIEQQEDIKLENIEGVNANQLMHFDRVILDDEITDIFLVPGICYEKLETFELPIVEKRSGDLLVQWYETKKADLPWRQNKDPYRIWISEIMLQQTQVATVIGYFQRFMLAFPNIQVLAKADEDDVLAKWEGLGYYSRARRIHECAKQVLAQYGGVFPQNYDEILALPGIGPYTAGAISSIAYGLPEPAIDGNVYRVMSRLHDVAENVSYRKGQKIIETLVREEMIHEAPAEFNQGMMELGRTICKGSSPDCHRCPWMYRCKSKAAMTIDERPVKKAKKPPVQLEMSTLVVTVDGTPCVVRRPDEGLLAKLWGFPIVEGKLEELLQGLNVSGEWSMIGEVEHIFSHRHWKMKVYHMEINSLCQPFELLIENASIKPLPTAFAKVYHCYLKNVK